MKPKGVGASKTCIYVFLGLVAGLIGYKLLDHLFSGPTCDAPSFRVVKVRGANGKTATHMFMYGHQDQTSDAVDERASQQMDLPDAGYHQFYHNYLCTGGNMTSTATTPTTKCEGIVLDIGAYLGTHALYLAQQGFQVHAFEPYPLSAQLLHCSVKANKLEKKMFVIKEGVSDANSRECMMHPLAVQSHQALFLPHGMGSCNNTNESISVVTLDHYWEAMLDKQPILFIKIDVEGHEGHVLDGAKALLAANPPPFILVEYYPSALKLKNVVLEDYLKKIYTAGYRIYDCQQKVEVKQGNSGARVLETYKKDGRATDLLLVQKDTYPGDLPAFGCGYVP